MEAAQEEEFAPLTSVSLDDAQATELRTTEQLNRETEEEFDAGRATVLCARTTRISELISESFFVQTTTCSLRRMAMRRCAWLVVMSRTYL